MEEKEKQENTEPKEPEYIGNIWGWKFSFISLGIILFFVAFIAIRHWMLGIPFDLKKVQPATQIDQDSTTSEQATVDSL